MSTEAIAPIRAPRGWSPLASRSALRRLLAGLVSGLLPSLLTACGPAPAPDPRAQVPDPGDCLSGVVIDQLQAAIARCDAVVAAHPIDPQPRNDRALLLSLAHRQHEACRDSTRAAALLAQLSPREPVDASMALEIQGRAASCRSLVASPTAPRPPSPILQQGPDHGREGLAP